MSDDCLAKPSITKICKLLDKKILAFEKYYCSIL